MGNIAKLFVYIELNSVKLPQEKIKMIWSDDDVFFSLKGDIYVEFEGKEKIEKIRHDDYCNIRYEMIQNGESLNDIMLAFIKKQSGNLDELINICSDINRKIHVCIYPEMEQYTAGFSTELMQLLSSSNIEIGLTILNF